MIVEVLQRKCKIVKQNEKNLMDVQYNKIDLLALYPQETEKQLKNFLIQLEDGRSTYTIEEDTI